MKKLSKIIDYGWSVEISNQVTRMEIDGTRQFVLRVFWEATRNTYNKKPERIQCEWGGFSTSEEAINNMLFILLKKQ